MAWNLWHKIFLKGLKQPFQIILFNLERETHLQRKSSKTTAIRHPNHKERRRHLRNPPHKEKQLTRHNKTMKFFPEKKSGLKRSKSDKGPSNNSTSAASTEITQISEYQPCPVGSTLSAIQCLNADVLDHLKKIQKGNAAHQHYPVVVFWNLYETLNVFQRL